MATKKSSRKKKFAPITTLAADLEELRKAQEASRPKFAPKTNLAEQIKRSVRKKKAE